MALISVVVPVYNVKNYLSWCLDSLIGQTLEDIEIIAVNDGSTDGSLEILRMYAEKDIRIRIIDRENGGLSSARNAGIRAATSPIVCFLDSDDRFTLDACETIVAAFDDGDGVPVDIVTFGANCYPDSFGYPWLREHLSPRNVTYSPFHIELISKEMSRPFAWRTACRIDFLRENDLYFDEDVRFGEDQVFHFAVYPRSAKTRLISNKLYDYRISRSGSLMERAQSNKLQMMLDHIGIMRAIFTDWSDQGYLEEYKNFMAGWVVEFMLFDSLTLGGEERSIALDSARKFLLDFWSIPQMEHFDIHGSTKQIILATAKGDVIDDVLASKMHRAWYLYSYGYASAVKGAARRVLRALRGKA